MHMDLLDQKIPGNENRQKWVQKINWQTYVKR